MSRLGVRLYTDEDVDAHLAEQLRRRGYDALSCREAGNAALGRSDEWQLDCATRAGRAILVHNIGHYVPIDAAWKAAGRAHRGDHRRAAGHCAGRAGPARGGPSGHGHAGRAGQPAPVPGAVAARPRDGRGGKRR